MTITHLLAVAPVTDIEASTAWYERLLGRPVDSRPMETLSDFHVTGTGWLQVFVDPARAGSAQLNLAVDDVDTALAALAADGFDTSSPTELSNGVVALPIADPDGNTVTVIGNLRHA